MAGNTFSAHCCCPGSKPEVVVVAAMTSSQLAQTLVKAWKVVMTRKLRRLNKDIVAVLEEAQPRKETN